MYYNIARQSVLTLRIRDSHQVNGCVKDVRVHTSPCRILVYYVINNINILYDDNNMWCVPSVSLPQNIYN